MLKLANDKIRLHEDISSQSKEGMGTSKVDTRYTSVLKYSSVVKIYIIRPKPGPVAKNATPRPSGWESNPRPLDFHLLTTSVNAKYYY